MAQTIPVQIICPVCELNYNYDVVIFINLYNNRDLGELNLLRVGKLNIVPCLACATTLTLHVPVVLNLPQDETLIIYVPNPAEKFSEAEITEIYTPFYQQFLASLPDEQLEEYMAEPFVVTDMDTFRLVASQEYDAPIEPKPYNEQEEIERLLQEQQAMALNRPQNIPPELLEEMFGTGNPPTPAPAPVPPPPASANEPELAAAEATDEDENDEDDEIIMTPEEAAEIDARMELLRNLFASPDLADRVAVLAADRAKVDQMFLELVEVLAEQAAATEPDKYEVLVQIYNQAIEFLQQAS